MTQSTLAIVIILTLTVIALLPHYSNAQWPTMLLTGWHCQSSEIVGTDGSVISTINYNDHTWYNARNGDTVMTALLNAGEYGGNDGIFKGLTMAQVRDCTFSDSKPRRDALESPPLAQRSEIRDQRSEIRDRQ